jgi:hypothetical protein
LPRVKPKRMLASVDALGRPTFDRLMPVSDDYATLPVAQAFTWDVSADVALEGEWYLVAFRSVQRAGADQDELRRMDDAAHEEAIGAPGFIHYFKGPANARGECLSFCLWDSRHDAREAAGRPAHVAAISIIGATYERYTLEFLRVAKLAGEGRFSFEPYDHPSPEESVPAPWAPAPSPA